MTFSNFGKGSMKQYSVGGFLSPEGTSRVLARICELDRDANFTGHFVTLRVPQAHEPRDEEGSGREEEKHAEDQQTGSTL
jgi:hypothetical protein